MFDLTEENGYAVNRRNFLRFAMAGSLGAAACWGLVPWRRALAQDSNEKNYKHEGGKTGAQAQLGKTLAGGGKCKAVIMLFLNGGPSHIDTFDPKPGRETGGPYKTVDAGHGILLSEHLPTIAKQGNRICVLRSVTSKEGSHERARFVMSTGYRPQGAVEFPGLGAIMSKEKGKRDFDLPQNVSVGGGGGPGGGILGARYAPFLVGDPTRPVEDMSFPGGVDNDRFARRTKLLDQVEHRFKEERDGGHLADTHREVYAKAERLLTSPLAKVFEVSEEKEEVRKAYGMGRFGQGVLMARRLVEAGVPFVEVTLGGWDTHQKNFEQVEKLSGELDPAMGTLTGSGLDAAALPCHRAIGSSGYPAIRLSATCVRPP
ncbi:DUF1501 domain-containing protein, partial [bacterium]|nr:DUF1501 domain-containing protein [bacterium]